MPSPPQTPQLLLARPRHAGFLLPLFLPPLILQALGIISSRGLAFTKAGKNLCSWPVSPKPGSVKLGYQLEMSVGGEEGSGSNSYFNSRSCRNVVPRSPGAHQRRSWLLLWAVPVSGSLFVWTRTAEVIEFLIRPAPSHPAPSPLRLTCLRQPSLFPGTSQLTQKPSVELSRTELFPLQQCMGVDLT